MEQRPVKQPSILDQKAPPEELFIIFVNAQIEKMKEYSHIGSDKEISFHELNSALCNYQLIYLTLLSLYNVAKIDHTKKKEEFDDWYADKYIDIRHRENRSDMSAQKWVAAKELEMLVRKEFKEEYRALNDEVLVADHKVSFLRRLLESWQTQQYVLSQLSKNIIAEVGSTNTENSLNNRGT